MLEIWKCFSAELFSYLAQKVDEALHYQRHHHYQCTNSRHRPCGGLFQSVHHCSRLRLNCPLWFYPSWNPEIPLSLSLSIQSSISASTPLLPRFNRSNMIYANSSLQSMASSTLLLLAASASIDSPNLNLHYWSDWIWSPIQKHCTGGMWSAISTYCDPVLLSTKQIRRGQVENGYYCEALNAADSHFQFAHLLLPPSAAATMIISI